MREEIIRRIEKTKLICIVRGVYGEDCVKLAKALYAGGIELMEVTFDQSQPDKLSQTSDTVSMLVREMNGKMDIGAGTVTTVSMLTMARDAGAVFIVSPDTNPDVIRATREMGLVSLPGAMTPTEILTAYRAGADFVKLFPASDLGPAYLKAVRAPLNHIPLLAVGGVSDSNIRAFLDAGAAGAGVGGYLANKTWIREGAWEKVTEAARSLRRNAGLL